MNAGARLNVAKIDMSDLLGTSPDLNGDYTFTRLNPMAGLSYKATDNVTAYGGYSESNRAPTPLRTRLRQPQQAVPAGRLPGFRSAAAAGRRQDLRSRPARQDGALNDGQVEWKAALFRTDSTNDIINVASAIQGRGVFQNVAATRRQGLEAGAEYRNAQWLLYANYSYTDATYQFSGLLASPNNPLADDNGNVIVMPGDRIPGIPQHQFKAGVPIMP